jgi:hypothetical protein
MISLVGLTVVISLVGLAVLVVLVVLAVLVVLVVLVGLVGRPAAVLVCVLCRGMARVAIRCNQVVIVILSADAIAIAQHLDPSAKRRRLEGWGWILLIADATSMSLAVRVVKLRITAAVIPLRLMAAQSVTVNPSLLSTVLGCVGSPQHFGIRSALGSITVGLRGRSASLRV